MTKQGYDYIPSETRPFGILPDKVREIQRLVAARKTDEFIAAFVGLNVKTVAAVRNGGRPADLGAEYIPTEDEIWGPLRAKRVAAGMPDVAHIDEIEE